ncbi:DLW-39 family protein [Mobilicoccus pelagius]|nr:DLW-39 family protein [Mobilicoccus pelagius]
MKRVVAFVVAAAGAAVAGRRWQARRAEQALWSQITDPAPPDTDERRTVGVF